MINVIGKSRQSGECQALPTVHIWHNAAIMFAVVHNCASLSIDMFKRSGRKDIGIHGVRGLLDQLFRCKLCSGNLGVA